MLLHPQLQGVRLLAFDLDGTLVDSVPDLAMAVDLTLAELDLPAAGEDQVRHWVGNGSLVLLQRALTGGMTDSKEADALLPLDHPALDHAHQLFLQMYDAVNGQHTRLYPGVKETLLSLKETDLYLALVTNKPLRFVPDLLEHFGLQGIFDPLLGGDSLPEKKPHPAPLLHLMHTFQLQANHCAMIGDSRHDIAAAKAAGFISVGVPYGYNHGEPLSNHHPDLMLKDLRDLLTITANNQGHPA